MTPLKVFFLITGITLIALLFPACGNSAPTLSATGVDMRFREFYDLQGGAELLGKPVSGAFNENGSQYQVLENGIMVYNPTATAGEQFNFQALAQNFVKQTSLPTQLAISGQTVLGGHIIYDEFSATFNRLGGLRFVGNPVTDVRKNNEESRYEQYFEKLGLYRMFSDPPGTVRLLPYGLMECRRSLNLNCDGNFQNAIPRDIPPQPFLPLVMRVGERLIGAPLSDVYLAPDNKLEQIYENVVLVFDPENPRTIEFRSVPEIVGVQRQTPVALRNDLGLTFWQTSGELGHNVPVAFLEYIAEYGGTELSGEPITELFEINGLRRQCFSNYCLEYDPNAPKEQQVRPTNLGYEYLKLLGFSVPAIHLGVWESEAVIAPDQTQIVGVLVYNQTPDLPMKDVQPTLTIWFDGKPAKEFIFPATSPAGTSFLEIPTGKLPGLTVYEVCVLWPGNDPVCVKDSWIVK